MTSQLAASFTWEQALAFRLTRQSLTPRGSKRAVEVARRLCGVQAQVASAAELAVAVRRRSPVRGEFDRALRGGALVKTWAMRGTLHLLPADQASTVISSLSRVRPWTSPAWERHHGVTASDVQRVIDALREVLSDEPMSREELGSAVAGRVRSKTVAAKIASGWGELLKPAAFAGVLLQGPSHAGRATFVRADAWVPEWRMLDPDEAGADLLRAYLGAYEPAEPRHVAEWWARARQPAVKPWFDRLGDEVVPVEVDGTRMFALRADLAAIARARSSGELRLLPNFDQYVLGPGSGSAAFVPAAHKAEVSRTAGWISPVVLKAGRVAGVWELDKDAGRIDVRAFESLSRAELADEAAHIGRFLGRELSVKVRR